jgi:hypothetical protein
LPLHPALLGRFGFLDHVQSVRREYGDDAPLFPSPISPVNGTPESDRPRHGQDDGAPGIDPGLEFQPGRQKSARDSHSIQTLKYPDELEHLVNKIAGQARLAEQEMGVLTFFGVWISRMVRVR